MSCVRNGKQMNDGSVNVKAIVAAVVALIAVVVIIVIATGNSATSELNKLIKNGDIDEAANYYLDKFEEKGKDISDKTLELLKYGIAQIEADYQDGDLTSDKAYEKLVAYRPFKEAGVEEEYDDLSDLLQYDIYIAEGDSYDEYMADGDETYYYHYYSDAYGAYYSALELANENESLDGSEATAGLQKIKDYMVGMAETYVDDENYESAYLCIEAMTVTVYFENDDELKAYLNEIYQMWMSEE